MLLVHIRFRVPFFLSPGEAWGKVETHEFADFIREGLQSGFRDAREDSVVFCFERGDGRVGASGGGGKEVGTLFTPLHHLARREMVKGLDILEVSDSCRWEGGDGILGIV